MPSGRGGIYYFLMYMDTVPYEFGVFQLAKYRRQKMCTVDGSNEKRLNHDNGACAVTIKLNQGITYLFFTQLESSNSIG